MTDNHYPEWHQHWSGWAYNQPGWQPRCDRCDKRRPDCKKFNAAPGEELAGRFAGRWLCPDCTTPADVKTPYQAHIDTPVSPEERARWQACAEKAHAIREAEWAQRKIR